MLNQKIAIITDVQFFSIVSVRFKWAKGCLLQLGLQECLCQNIFLEMLTFTMYIAEVLYV
jgi:hypothetical protein